MFHTHGKQFSTICTELKITVEILLSVNFVTSVKVRFDFNLAVISNLTSIFIIKTISIRNERTEEKFIILYAKSIQNKSNFLFCEFNNHRK